MAALKGQETERAITKPDPAYRVILLYGPDTGLVSERAERLARATGVDVSDPFSTIRLDADAIAEDRSRLSDEAFTVGMFGGERLIRVSGQTRRNLAEAVKPVLEAEVRDAWIIIEAGDLDKRSALRTLFEKASRALAIPCYQDSESAIETLIREEITAAGLKISRETVAFLRPFLGADRLASRNELRKLALLAMDDGEITPAHIRAIVGDASRFGTDDIIDAVATGDLERFEANFARVLEEGLSPDMLLLFALRHFQQLHELRARVDGRRQSPDVVISGVRPPVHFQRRGAMVSALGKWKLPGLERAMQRLSRAAFEARSMPHVAQSVAGTALLAVVVEASRL